VRALQEDFLRLQQQFVSLQMQTANQQVDPPAAGIADAIPAADRQAPKEEIRPASRSDSKPVESETEEERSAAGISPIPTDSAPESPKYHYSGPPAVKLEPWKPGRPRSEILDFSRSSSFNVPPLADSTVAVAATAEVKLTEVVEEVKVVETNGEVTKSEADEAEVNIRPSQMALRRSPLVTAPRPFEPRSAALNSKRPSFPSVIQPVPFVQRKIRVPEVRGFSTLPKAPEATVPAPSVATKVAPPVKEKPRLVSAVSCDNPALIRSQIIIQSARRPSAEFTTHDDDDQVIYPNLIKLKIIYY
jgi:hypothetical protein